MNTPLPKPTVPQTPNTSPSAGGPTVPQGQVKQAPPVASPQKPPGPVPQAVPQAPKPPQQAATSQVPKAVAQPANQGGAPAQVQAPKQAAPSAPVPPAANSGQALPPTSLSALSSMNSTQIPKNNVTAVPQDPSVKPTPVSSQQAPPQSMSGPGSKPPMPPTPPPAGDAGKAAKPKFASVERPMAKYAIIGAIVVVVLGLLGGLAYYFFGGDNSTSISTTTPTTNQGGTQREVVPGEETVIEYWGLWEPSEVMGEVISEFETENPGVKVQYTKQSHLNYRERLQTAVASGNGPDVFRFHASWTPMLIGELKPIPNSVMSAAEFKATYYPVAAQQLQANGQYVGIPMMYDGLALLYNKDMFETAGIDVPTDWAAVKEAATKLVIKNSSGDISRGGIALGNASNVDHFSDIVGLLMLQNGAVLSEADSQEVADALSFYTSFQTSDEVWSSVLPNSTVAFAREEVAMILAPSWRIHEILAQNPDLNFGVSTVPIIGDQLAWATFWAEGINSKSKNQDEAAAFLKFISKKETLEKFYDAASQTRAFGEIYPRMDMASSLVDDEYVAPYLADAPYAKGWYVSSFTHDNGLNDQLIKYYEDAITAMVVDGKKATAVQSTLDSGVSQVLRQYGVSGALAK